MLGAVGAGSPAGFELARGIAPVEQLVESNRVRRDIQHAAERAAFILDGDEGRNASLAGFASLLEFVDVVAGEVFVFLVQQFFEACERSCFLDQQPFKGGTTDLWIHELDVSSISGR